MARCTEEELQEMMRYKAEKASTMAQDQDRNMMSIMRMSNDLMKTLTNTQQYIWTDPKRRPAKNNKNFVSHDHDRNCYTQRGKSPQQNLDNDGLSQFDESQIPFNQNDQFSKGIERFKFLQLNDVEKTEYVPMKKKLNPEIGNTSKKTNGNNNASKINKVQKETIKKNHLQKELKNPSTVNQLPKPKPKPKILTQTKSSSTLTNQIKHIKKNILEAVQIKKQAEQKRYCMTPKHTSIKQFYSQNTDHIPLYQKSKILTIKKLFNLEQSRMMKQSAEIQEVTFWPMVNTKSEELIKGKTFYSRLEETMNRKQTNQGRIMYETMKPCTFVPKLNDNKLIESKVRKIWTENDTNQFHSQSVIKQEDEDENLDYHVKNRNWLAIRLQKEIAQKLFID